MHRKILELSHQEAKAFFLESKSYCSLNLPCYFDFSDLLKKLSSCIGEYNISTLKEEKFPTDINHTILVHKNNRLSWRNITLIHPIYYIDLVNTITQEKHWEELKKLFNKFNHPQIQCTSIPIVSKSHQYDEAVQIQNWWEYFEQKSMEVALEYDFLFKTDISDCYNSIYTHSIAWAIHTKDEAKSNRNDKKLIGNKIDKLIQNIQNGQTNGIPQGSVLMDFIAEIVLGYADIELAKILENEKIANYYILRYRDDYRIFVKNSNNGEVVLKKLAEILFSLGLNLNNAKTKYNENIISGSLKEDKVESFFLNQNHLNLQKQLFSIHQFSQKYPNSGSVVRLLTDISEKIQTIKSIKHHKVLIAITLDIAIDNPRTVPVCFSIISYLLRLINRQDQKIIKDQIYKKILEVSRSGIVQIWLQRLLKNELHTFKFNENYVIQ